MSMKVEIDDTLLHAILQMSKAKTEKEAVEEAIRSYLRILALQDLMDLRGKVDWDGDLNEMRSV